MIYHNTDKIFSTAHSFVAANDNHYLSLVINRPTLRSPSNPFFVRPQTVAYTNSVVHHITYDSRQRVKTTSITVGGVAQVTTNTWNLNGELAKMALADGTFIQHDYAWETAGNPLTSSDTDAASNKAQSTFNAAGEVTNVKTLDAASTTYLNRNKTYDALGRVLTETNFDGSKVTTYTYDKNDNVLSVKDGNNHTTSYGYDVFDRRHTVTDANRGALYHLLSNRIYIGLLIHKNEIHEGQHEAIIDKDLWDRVQQHMAHNAVQHKVRSRITEHCPLTDKLFDSAGERLVPVHTIKAGRRYRYYISESLRSGIKGDKPDGWRLPGQEIENTICRAAVSILNDRDAITTAVQSSGIASYTIPMILNAAETLSKADTCTVIDRVIGRVELNRSGIRIMVALTPLLQDASDREAVPTITRDVPMVMKRRGNEMRLVIEGNPSQVTKVDHVLLKTIARAHVWSEQLLSGRVPSMTEIASQNGVSVSYVKKLMPLAFLAPNIVEAIVEGKQPEHLSKQMLIRDMDIPLEWAEQMHLTKNGGH